MELPKDHHWFHTITLPDGTKTPGDVSEEWQNWTASPIPLDLKGQHVLDIGAWDGYYSFLCAQRGATVVATDVFQNKSHCNREGFDFCRQALGLQEKVKLVLMDAHDSDQLARLGPFNLVLMLGLLYHLEGPLLALRKVRKVMTLGSQLIIESCVRYFNHAPLCHVYWQDHPTKDAFTYWAMAPEFIERLCYIAGFSKFQPVASRADRFLAAVNY